jgi:hypothetical protein
MFSPLNEWKNISIGARITKQKRYRRYRGRSIGGAARAAASEFIKATTRKQQQQATSNHQQATHFFFAAIDPLFAPMFEQLCYNFTL